MNEGLVEAIKSITGDGSHGDPENRKMEGKTQILGMKHPCPKQPRAPTRFKSVISQGTADQET